MADENIVAPENEDAELDKSLEDSIAAVKAGNELKPQAVAATPAEAAEPQVEDPSNPQAPKPKIGDDSEFRVPNKGKFESDESYEKRIQLFDLVKQRKAAKTPEAKEKLTVEIQTTKNQLKTLNGADKVTPSINNPVSTEKPNEEEDEATKQDRERLKHIGGATKDDIQEIIRQERVASETKSTLDKFVDRYPEFKDEDVREVFFDFVDSNYNWSNKTGKELMTVLELARENMFKPSETIQERVLKGANVQEKINAMQFPGGTVARSDYSPEMRKSIDELKATGMSEEKAVELLSD